MKRKRTALVTLGIITMTNVYVIELIPKDCGSPLLESSTISSPDSESLTTSGVSPTDVQPHADAGSMLAQTADEEDKEQDKANRTARVQPSLQTPDASSESPNTPSTEKRK